MKKKRKTPAKYVLVARPAKTKGGSMARTRALAVRRSPARRRRNGNGGFGFKLPVAPLIALASGLVWCYRVSRDPNVGFGQAVVWGYSGFMPWEHWRYDNAGYKRTLYPLLVGMGAHYMADRLGVNKMFRRLPVEI